MKEVVAVIKRYLSLKHRQRMLFGQASQNYTLYQGAIVTKLPDKKPLKLVGCFSPWAKSGNWVLARILAFYAVKTCSKHAFSHS